MEIESQFFILNINLVSNSFFISRIFNVSSLFSKILRVSQLRVFVVLHIALPKLSVGSESFAILRFI